MAVLRVGDILNPAGYTLERVLERLEALPVGTVARDSSGEYWLEKLTADTYEVNHPGNDDSCGWDYSVTPEYVAELIARTTVNELLNAPVYSIEKLKEQEPTPTSRPRTKIPAKTRQQVYAKYDGRCAYCGREITQRQMRVDHFTPHCNGGADTLDNLMPSCHDCNAYKLGFKLETFRRHLQSLVAKYPLHLRERLAIRYGGAKPEWDGKFYFETLAEREQS